MSAAEVEPITLIKPITVTLKRAGEETREETITELAFHPFKARDLRALDGLGENAHGSQILALMARMVRQPVSVIDELEAEDFQVLAKRVEGFMPAGPSTGATG